jgi:hypothetical protein
MTWVKLELPVDLDVGEPVPSSGDREPFPTVRAYVGQLDDVKRRQLGEVLNASDLNLDSNALDVLFHDNILVRPYFASTLVGYVELIRGRI